MTCRDHYQQFASLEHQKFVAARVRFLRRRMAKQLAMARRGSAPRCCAPSRPRRPRSGR